MLPASAFLPVSVSLSQLCAYKPPVVCNIEEPVDMRIWVTECYTSWHEPDPMHDTTPILCPQFPLAPGFSPPVLWSLAAWGPSRSYLLEATCSKHWSRSAEPIPPPPVIETDCTRQPEKRWPRWSYNHILQTFFIEHLWGYHQLPSWGYEVLPQLCSAVVVTPSPLFQPLPGCYTSYLLLWARFLWGCFTQLDSTTKRNLSYIITTVSLTPHVVRTTNLL